MNRIQDAVVRHPWVAAITLDVMASLVGVARRDAGMAAGLGPWLFCQTLLLVSQQVPSGMDPELLPAWRRVARRRPWALGLPLAGVAGAMVAAADVLSRQGWREAASDAVILGICFLALCVVTTWKGSTSA